jgi:hypothetical protein
MVTLSRGIAAFLQGRWSAAVTLCDRAEGIFRDPSTNVLWGEINTSQFFALWSLIARGEIASVSDRCPMLLKEARERGDLYAVTNLSTYPMTIVHLASGSSNAARRLLGEAMEQWSHEGFHVQHHHALLAEMLIELYDGNAHAAWNALSQRWRSYRRSLLWRVQQVRGDILYLRARTALSLATIVTDSAPLLRLAQRDAVMLAREHMPWTSALAKLIMAAIASRESDTTGAERLLRESIADLESVEMHLHAAAGRYALGSIVGGVEGSELRQIAEEWTAGQRVCNTASILAMVAPEFVP